MLPWGRHRLCIGSIDSTQIVGYARECVAGESRGGEAGGWENEVWRGDVVENEVGVESGEKF